MGSGRISFSNYARIRLALSRNFLKRSKRQKIKRAHERAHKKKAHKKRVHKKRAQWLELAYFQEACCSNDDHQRVGKFFNPLFQALVFIPGANAGAALQSMADKHAVIRKELASLRHVVIAAAKNSCANDTDNSGKQVVMLLQGARVCCVDLQLRIGGEETGIFEGAEDVGVEDVLGTGARLGQLEDDGETGILEVLLISIV